MKKLLCLLFVCSLLAVADDAKVSRDLKGKTGNAPVDATSLSGIARSVEYLGSTVQVGVDVVGLDTFAHVVKTMADALGCETGTPVLLRDVATVVLGPQIRRGLMDWNGEGDAVGLAVAKGTAISS